MSSIHRQVKPYEIDIFRFSAKHTALRSESIDGLARNQYNVSKWRDGLHMDCCFSELTPVPDLPLCLGVLKHRAPWPPIFLPTKFFYDGFLLCDAILNLKAFCFGAIPTDYDRVDSLWECVTFRAQVRGLIT